VPRRNHVKKGKPLASKDIGRRVLLIGCRDEKGLVHKITGVLFRQGFNIVRNGEFVDVENGRFYMRTEFEGACKGEELTRELTSLLPEGAWVQLELPRPKDLVILATREHHCLGDLLLRHAHGDLNARILAVVSNHDVLADLVGKFDVPFHYVPHAGCTRGEHERQVADILAQYALDYLVLAKYMRILSSEFVGLYSHRIINIHHSFLPAFIGANPYRQAFERGVKIIGATAHFVTDDLDEGPIIAQSVIPVDHRQNARDMARAGRDVEMLALARALDLVLADQVVVVGNRTIIFD
jgi:formyltetrahydrofolate deformylase